jgi:hypothetical protein
MCKYFRLAPCSFRITPESCCEASFDDPGENLDAARPDFLPSGKKSALDPPARRMAEPSCGFTDPMPLSCGGRVK